MSAWRQRSEGARLATAAAAWLGLAAVGCDLRTAHQPGLMARLWKHGRPPVELPSGGQVRAGDELFMTVTLQRASYLYVVAGALPEERRLVYPCRLWGRSHLAGRTERLPPLLLGRETFWPVRNPRRRERLVVIATRRPAAALEAAVLADREDEPCAAAVGAGASRWLDRLQLDATTAAADPGTAVVTYDLVGAAREQSGA